MNQLPAPPKLGLIYLASPYAPRGCSRDSEYIIRNGRYNAAVQAAAWLIKQGYMVYSPIAHSHPIAETDPENLHGHKIWLRIDEEFLNASHTLIILCLSGWENSVGVARETELADSWDMPIFKMLPIEGGYLFSNYHD